MTIYGKHLSNPWFTYVRQGKKFIEGRLNKKEWSNMEVGDYIL